MQRTTDRWIEALLSGRYVQGTGRLSEVQGRTRVHCVMGVLVDLDFQLQKAQERHVPINDRIYGCTWRDSGRIMEPAYERLVQLGLGWLVEKNVPGIEGHHMPQDVLISMNDNGSTFEQLAETIRSMEERYAEAA